MNPIGLLEHPADFATKRRSYSKCLRLGAAVVLSAFLVVGVLTTVYSLGTYCLTSHAGLSSPFPR